jgi:hypothetical protein
LTSFAQVNLKVHGENPTDAELLNLQDNDLAPLDGDEIGPVFQDRHEELDRGAGAQIPDITESDDDDREREEEELSIARAKPEALFERRTDRRQQRTP